MPVPENELIALLRLQKTPHIGDVNAKRLIDKCGSALAVFNEKKSSLLKITGIGTHTIAALHDSAHAKAAEREFHFMEKNAIAYWHFQDEAYPKHLKHCLDAPILLFKKGAIALEGRKLVSVVGTRNCTNYGQAFCERFIEEIAPLNPVIVSGFAYGVDMAIHKAAMQKGLQTVACFAHGLNQVYPQKHSKYVAQVIKNGGFVTEFHSSDRPEREHFLKRNRIIAGLSEATVVVESAERGGSLVTADMANGYHRDVFAVPGRSNDKYSVGCNNLIKQQKAHMLTSAADLVYLLNWQVEETKPKPVQKELFAIMGETERSIYSYLQLNGKQVLDTVAFSCGLPIFKTSSVLLNMEMKGMVRPLPGNVFEAV